jgi:hypothetical protein
VSDDDPQRTQEWDAEKHLAQEPGATTTEAEEIAAANEATAQAKRAMAEARNAELRAELAETDARRAEEQADDAQEDVEEAEQRVEKLSRKERKAKEKAEKAVAEAEQAARQAEAAERLARETTPAAPAPTVSGASVMSPGIGSTTDPAAAASANDTAYREPVGPQGEPSALERPEVLAGLVFAGAFVGARILKRLID